MRVDIENGKITQGEKIQTKKTTSGAHISFTQPSLCLAQSVKLSFPSFQVKYTSPRNEEKKRTDKAQQQQCKLFTIISVCTWIQVFKKRHGHILAHII